MTTLMAIGGAVDFEEPIIFKEFIKRAGGAKARIVVLPQASGLKDTGKEYVKTFQELGVKAKTISLEFRERKEADKKTHLEALRNATGIFESKPSLARAPTTLDMTDKKSEVVFSFDTTGSMYPWLTPVRGKINECVERLFKEIGADNLRIGITAHGDYCDAGRSYVTKHLPTTNNISSIVKFVETVEATGGGDAPECYELVLHEALSFPWTKGWNHVVVLIGDELPHEKNAEWGVITISLGGVCADPAIEKVVTLFREADALLYKAKEAVWGRINVSILDAMSECFVRIKINYG